LLMVVHAIYLNGSAADLLNMTAIELVALAVLIAYAIKRRHLELRSLIRLLMHGREGNVEETIKRFYYYALVQKERGHLALEKELENEQDAFVRRGSLLAIEGVPEDELRMILENELKGEQYRYQQAAGFFRLISLLAPGMGLVGTLVGMTGVLKTLRLYHDRVQSQLGGGGDAVRGAAGQPDCLAVLLPADGHP